MEEFHAQLRQLTALRWMNLDKGACGVIDQIALSALEFYGNVAKALQRFAQEDSFCLPDDTVLLFHRGKVTIGCGTLNDAKVEFDRNSAIFRSTYIPAARLRKAVGRPVTELFDHLYLSDDMTVLSAGSEYGNGALPSVVLTLSMPQWFFCSISGCCWKEQPKETFDIIEPLRSGSTVIPFRRPAA